jgi:hypothetical protein
MSRRDKEAYRLFRIVQAQALRAKETNFKSLRNQMTLPGVRRDIALQ